MNSEADGQGPIKIVFTGDIHYGPAEHFRPGGEIPSLIATLVETLNNEIKPDVVLEMGDRLNNVDLETDTKNLSFLVDALDHKLKAPCYHILGNHDIIFLDKKTISRILGTETGPSSRIIKGFKLISIDTVDPIIDKIGGAVGREQLEWLNEEMNADGFPKLVFGHHAIDDLTLRGNAIFTQIAQYYFVENKKEVCRILEEGNNFIGYANGHSHWFSFSSGLKGTYLGVPSLTEAYPLRSNAMGAFMEADIYQDGKIEAAVHTLNPRRCLGRFTNR